MISPRKGWWAAYPVAVAKAAWVITGALFGFSLLALTSIGIVVLPLTLVAAAVLAAMRLRGGLLFVVAAGVTFALAWLSLVIDPNAPDDSPWPIAVGALVAVVAWGVYRRSKDRAGG